MTQKRDLFQLFRDNQHKLAQSPPPRTWRRLEQRLDAHKGRPRISMFRTLGMVAAVLALVVLVSLISLLAGGPENRLLAIKGQPSPTALEDLRHTDADPYDLQTVKITQQAQQQLRRPISEGSASQKLMVARRNPASNSGPADISAFNWLLGRWLSDSNGKTMTESWTQLSPQSIEGAIVPEGQRKAIELMRIFEKDGKLFFRTSTLPGENEWFTLVSLSEQEALFENPALDFPQQVIFRRESQGEVVTLYRNREPSENAPQTLRRLQRMTLQ